MDDKTFIASYVAQETMRIKDRLKQTVESVTPPSEEEKDLLMQDMRTTLERLHKSIQQIQTMLDADDESPAGNA